MAGRFRITVTGIVQGVGFRPYVYRLARDSALKGYVVNTSSGVVIEVEGEAAGEFASALQAGPPPLAEIKSIKVENLPPAGYPGFEIRVSEPVPGSFSLVSPDIATCDDCLREMRDPADRRHLYPFTNCTNCGPRYSIVKGVPYDRPLTTMKDFEMCPACRAEYEDPTDRRFHAQPTACPECGPRVFFLGKPEGKPDYIGPVAQTVDALRSGKIVAIKGLGGFHLACDAKDHEAVSILRESKRKNLKPFAVMAKDVRTVRRYCRVSDAEESLLAGRVRPIVLLEKLPAADTELSAHVAPGNAYLGFMLPYTPLHHLLFEIGGESNLDALVMTSGNLSEEPIVIDNDEAVEKLAGLADCFLLHDRGIYMRVDDSVARVVSGVPRLLRRARGIAPEPIDLGREMPEILACGAELKNTLCLTKGRYAVMSQHIGDLSSYEASVFFEETLDNLKGTFSARPGIVAHDMHPDYLSTRLALGYARREGIPSVAVQHHHAHIASCMAENGYAGEVIGVALDGTGYGTDGKVWGGEFLLAGLDGFTRFAHLNYMKLPGGDMAVRQPWRLALSCLHAAYGDAAPDMFRRLKGNAVPDRDMDIVTKMLVRGTNSPHSSGMGRLFDAVSSLLGIRDEITFEGEAAIALEAAASDGRQMENSPYRYELTGGDPVVIDTSPLVHALADDLVGGSSKGEISARFHATVADMVFNVCMLAREKTGVATAALSGGVFQNALLSGMVERGLSDAGFRVLVHCKVPANDGCVSLGQAAVAAARAV